MRRFLLGVLGLLICASGQAALVKEDLELGPLHVSVPRWHQGIDLENLSASADYLPAQTEPKPFSAIETIEVRGRLSGGGVLYLNLRSAGACSPVTSASARDNVVHGRRCVVWEDGSYVVVDYYARFGSASLQRGKEFLALVSVEIKGSSSSRVRLYQE